MSSHFTVAFTCPHATPGPGDPSCNLLGMESETTMVAAESGFLLTSCSFWGGRGELGRDFRHSLGLNCSHHFCQMKRWNWEANLLCEGSWLWLPRKGTKPGWTWQCCRRACGLPGSRWKDVPSSLSLQAGPP